jgi:hypothetical protein
MQRVGAGQCPPVKPVTACGALVSLTDYDLSITSASTVAGTSNYPERCRVLGQIQPEIRFDVSLPAMWNGRLYMFGNGGYAGESLDGMGRLATARRAMARGFAVAQTNTGHDSAVEPLGSFAVSPQKFLDYAYRAVHVTALTAKAIARTYYGSAPRRSYFDGCSTGGRQGLISAQRFPDDFDRILVGAPVLDFSGTMLDYLVNQRALAAAPVSSAKMRLVADAVYEQCDAADGVRDGVIDDPRTCSFKPSSHLTRCATGEDGATCFTAGEIDALETVYRDERRNGELIFPGWPVGSEIATTGQKGGEPAAATAWQPWFITTAGVPSRHCSARRSSGTWRLESRTPRTTGSPSTATRTSRSSSRCVTRSMLPIRICHASKRAGAGSSATTVGRIQRSTR